MPPIRDSPNVSIKQLVVVAKRFTRIDRMIFLRAKAVSLKPMSAHLAAERRASPWADLNCSETEFCNSALQASDIAKENLPVF
jgi:hypothetical protein